MLFSLNAQSVRLTLSKHLTPGIAQASLALRSLNRCFIFVPANDVLCIFMKGKLLQKPFNISITHIFQQIRHCERSAAISPSSPKDSSEVQTRLPPRWYIKHAMREIASCLAMTAEADSCLYPKGYRHFLIVSYNK